MFICMILVVCCLVGRVAPGDAAHSLKSSALAALESSFNDFAPAVRSPERPSGEDVRLAKPQTGQRNLACVGSRQLAAIERGQLKTREPRSDETNPAKTTPRKRVTPFQAKRVAASQGWRCGCGCVDPQDPLGRGHLLDETFEVDHLIPTQFGGEHAPSNWVAKLRSHHMMKSALETQTAAQLRRVR